MVVVQGNRRERSALMGTGRLSYFFRLKMMTISKARGVGKEGRMECRVKCMQIGVVTQIVEYFVGSGCWYPP